MANKQIIEYTSPDLEDLLTQAVNLRGTPENIEEWAHQLAADVGCLVD